MRPSPTKARSTASTTIPRRATTRRPRTFPGIARWRTSASIWRDCASPAEGQALAPDIRATAQRAVLWLHAGRADAGGNAIVAGQPDAMSAARQRHQHIGGNARLHLDLARRI